MSKRKLTYLPFALVAFALLLVQCKNYEVDSLEELQQLVSNPPPELSKQVSQGDFTFQIDYLPSEFLLLREYEYLEELKEREANEEAISRQLGYLEQYRKGYESVHQFKLTITPNDDTDLIYAKMGQGFNSYSQWLQKLLFGIKDEINLQLPDGTEIPVVDYRMDRNYGTSPSRTFLLTFPKEWNGEQLMKQDYLLLEINEFGLGTGKVQAKFSMPFPTIIYTNQSLEHNNS
ncbi:MAG: hypothetical protein ED557_14575 [Balneola sp.]|nr:MAG: hypothetical protein ED557_14575 [Balneola sp.]